VRMTHSRVCQPGSRLEPYLASVISGELIDIWGLEFKRTPDAGRCSGRWTCPAPSFWRHLAAGFLQPHFERVSASEADSDAPPAQPPPRSPFLSSAAMRRRASSIAFSSPPVIALAASIPFAARSTSSAAFATAQAPIARAMPFSL